MPYIKNILIILLLISCSSKEHVTTFTKKMDLIIKVKDYDDTIAVSKIHEDTTFKGLYNISFKEGKTDTTEIASIYLDSVELGKLYGEGISTSFLVQLYPTLIKNNIKYAKNKQTSNK